jgi:hypothetical protein
MNKQKYSLKVYGCPFCWFKCLDFGEFGLTGKDRKKNPDYRTFCRNKECERKYTLKETICFDSQAEAAVGLWLRDKEKRRIIRDLKHHVNIPIMPSPRIFENELGDIYVNVSGSMVNVGFLDESIYNTKSKRARAGATLKIWNNLAYECDFWFIENRSPVAVEVKMLDESKGVPFFAGNSLPAFRHKCELIKAIHGLDVSICTVDMHGMLLWWRWDPGFKKLEVKNENII